MENAMKAAMTTPPTVPATMRMVLVLMPPLEAVWSLEAATAVEVAVDVELETDDVRVILGMTVGTGVVVGLARTVGVVVVGCTIEVIVGRGVDEVVGDLGDCWAGVVGC